ncbi:MAG: GNAT family N-acetyltransferase [Eubacterium sp.]|jgi:hypothetical protein|nr:GNAT family N-acetyltransferase [Eubacterium sp.]
MEIKIRKAQRADLASALPIYDRARKYMKEHGNPTQWPSYYPGEEDLREHEENGELYVGVDENGRIHMAFAFCTGDEPNYRVIEDGAWPDDEAYGTIHMLASDGAVPGCFQACLEFCKSQISNIRADTHENNRIMNALFLKNGFVRCGTIYVENGTPRTAYQLKVNRAVVKRPCKKV